MPKARRDPVQLTDFKVKALKPDPAGGEFIQGDLEVSGFGVRVRGSGVKSFIVMKRRPGQAHPTRITIGRVGDITLAEARQKAREAIIATRRGIRVNVHKRQDRAVAKQVMAATGYAPGTFGEVAERYIGTECRLRVNPSETESVIRRRLLPVWGDRLIEDLRQRDLTAITDAVLAEGKPGAAYRVRQTATRLFNFAVERGTLEINYLLSGSRGRRGGVYPPRPRDRVLSDDEIRAIWQACEPDRTAWPYGDLIRLALLLGQRRDEIRGMEWADLDLDRGVWTIPARKYKTKIAHIVPLPAAAVEILQAVPRLCDRYVLATGPGRRPGGLSRLKARLDTVSGVTAWRLHDLRRTMRTGLAALRVDSDVAERVIGHVIGGVRGTYDRYRYEDEKRDALERWARRLEIIVNPPRDNVVSLAAG